MELSKADVAAKIAEYYQTQLTQGPVDVVVHAFKERPEGGHDVQADIALKADVESGNADKIALTIGCSAEGTLDWSSAVVDATGSEKAAPAPVILDTTSEPPKDDPVSPPTPADAIKPDKEMPQPDSGVEFVTDKAAGGEATPAETDHPAAALAVESKKRKAAAEAKQLKAAARRVARAKARPVDGEGWPTGDTLLVQEKTMTRTRINEDGSAVDGSGDGGEDGYSVEELMADEQGGANEVDFESMTEQQQSALVSAMVGTQASGEEPVGNAHPLEESATPLHEKEDEEEEYDMDGELNNGEAKPAEEGKEDTASEEEVGDFGPDEDLHPEGTDEFIAQIAAEFAEQGADMVVQAVEAYCATQDVECTPEIIEKARAAFESHSADTGGDVDVEVSYEEVPAGDIVTDPVIGLASLLGTDAEEIEDEDEEEEGKKKDEKEEVEESEKVEGEEALVFEDIEERAEPTSGAPEEESAHVEEKVMQNTVMIRLGETATTYGIAEAIHARFPELKFVVLEGDKAEAARQMLFEVDAEWDLKATVDQVREALSVKAFVADVSEGPQLTEDEVATYSFGLAGGSQGIGMDKEGYQGQKQPTTKKDPEYKEKNTSPGPKKLSGTPEGEQGGAQAAGMEPTKGDKKKQQKVGASTNDDGTDGSPGPKKLAKVHKDQFGGSGNKAGAKKMKGESLEDALVTFLTETVGTHLKEQNPFAKDDDAQEADTEAGVEAEVADEMGAEEADYGAEFAGEAADLDPVIVAMVQAQADHSLSAAHEVAEAYFSEQGIEYSDEHRAQIEEIFKSFSGSEDEIAGEEEFEDEVAGEEEAEMDAEGGPAVGVDTEKRGMEYESLAAAVLGDALYAEMIKVKKRLKQETLEKAKGDKKLTERLRVRVAEALKEDKGSGAVIPQKDAGGHPDSWQRVQMKAGTRNKTGRIKPNVKFQGKVRVVWDDGHEEFIEPSKLNNTTSPKSGGGEQAKPGSDKAPQMSSKEWGGNKGLESIQRESDQRRKLDTAVEHLINGGKFPEGELIEVLVERADEFKAPLKIESIDEAKGRLGESVEEVPAVKTPPAEETDEITAEEDAELDVMAEAVIEDEEFTIITEDMGEETEEFNVSLTEDEDEEGGEEEETEE